MLDAVFVFSRVGLVLWSHVLSPIKGDPVGCLVRDVLMSQRAGEAASAARWNKDSYTLEWVFENRLGLVFVAVYQRSLHLAYIPALLAAWKADFLARCEAAIVEAAHRPVEYEDFGALLRRVEEEHFRAKKAQQQQQQQRLRSPRRGADSGGSGSSGEEEDPDADGDEPAEGPGDDPAAADSDEPAADDDGPAAANTLDAERRRLALERKARGAAKQQPRKKPELKKTNSRIKPSNSTKNLDVSKRVTDAERDAKRAEDDERRRAEYMPAGAVADIDAPIADEEEQASAWSLGNTRIGSLFQRLTGNKSLAEDDLEPVFHNVKSQLQDKNVAQDVADALCDSVMRSMEGQKLQSFTRVETVVQSALTDAVTRILTPDRSTDILREVAAAKAAGRPYTIVFTGINGVGKSTSLSKVAFYLKSNGVDVLLAAGDTFRSGAVEQLQVHGRCLDVPVYDKGYGKEPSAVARDAMAYARDHGHDVVLVDTAGRMQNSEPLMRQLGRLIGENSPDLVLFVGEALVGNDGINQLQMFNRACVDYAGARPHPIDGVVLTKFDTIDDKVGAALSLAFKSGVPILFVGIGQAYPHLRRLNVGSVVRSLLS